MIFKGYKNFIERWKMKVQRSLRAAGKLPQLAIVQLVDEPAANLKLFEDCGVNVHVYVFQKPEEIEWEMRQLEEFYDGVVRWRICPKGIIEYLRLCGFPFIHSRVLVLGDEQDLVRALSDEGCQVSMCVGESPDYRKYVYEADLIISAVGQDKFFDCFLTETPVIDAYNDCYNMSGRQVFKHFADINMYGLIDEYLNTVNWN